jgi:hypothetical protein
VEHLFCCVALTLAKPTIMYMKGWVLVSGMSLSVMASAAFETVVLDDFATGAYDTGYISSNNVGQWVNASSAVGGSRFVSLNVTSNPLDNAAKARVRTSGTQDFSLILDPGVQATSMLQYGKNGLGLDMMGYQDVSLAFNTADRDLKVKLTLFGTNNSTLKSWTQTYNNIDGSGVLKFGMGDTSSFGKVERLAFEFVPKTGADFSLRKVTATVVPEPSAMLALGFGALVLIRRRKSR